MSAPANLEEIYTHELQDLWSANDQMAKVMPRIAEKAKDAKLKQRLEKSVEGINAHTQTIKQLLEDAGGEVSKEHCKGMEGLVKEATKHVLEEDYDDDAVRDVIIIAQFQRMSHYGICGFGTAKAYAEALGMDEHVAKLDDITGGIYSSDENMSQLAEMSVNLKAK